MDTFDLVVIGSGPAGEKGAAQAAYFGKRVAVVERGPLGGACVNTGTLPSKCLRESALHLSGLRTRGIAGLGCELPPHAVRVDRLMAHKARVTGEEADRIRRNLERHGCELVRGTAEILDPETVLVRLAGGGERRLSTRVILVATGSRPHRPKNIAFDRNEIYDSDEILALDFVPRELAVVGAGVIGCEYAAMFAALGTHVTLIEPRDRLLPFVDDEIAEALLRSFRAMGMEVRFGAAVEAARVEGRNDVRVTLRRGPSAEGGAGEGAAAGREEMRVEKLLYAAGRSGNTEGLGLERVGVAVDKRGQIAVDEHYRTACPTIYAAGDVIGFPALASTSMDQGRIAMCHAFDLKYKTALARHLPYGIYTIPEISMVGETEQAIRARGEDCEVGRAFFRDNARGKIVGAAEGLLKLVFRPADRRLLGVHIVGESAAELVHIGLTVLQFEGTIDAFIQAVYNYPTLGEAYKYAAYDGLGRLAKRAAGGVAAAPRV
jgi:NAD(P) transhydrogenase